MKTIILKRILILIIPVFLFIGGYQAKADTFTWMDMATYNLGGAGFDICSHCHYNYTFQTNAPFYFPAETAYISLFLELDGTITPLPGGIKMLAGTNTYTIPNGLLFNDDFVFINNDFVNANIEIYTEPTYNLPPFDPYYLADPPGRYILYYQGSYSPDMLDVLYPYLTLDVLEASPTNDNPVVDVR